MTDPLRSTNATERMGPVPFGDRALSLALVASLLFCAAFIARTAATIAGETYFTLFDDAMISMRYARNLAEGHGLVWNPGGPAVEGYTNPLWTLWMALLHRLPLAASKVSLAVMISGAALLVANVAVVARIAWLASRGSAFVTALASWLTALDFGLAFWTLRGNEVGALTLIVSGALLLLIDPAPLRGRRLAVLALLVGGASVVRSDGIVPAVVVAAFAIQSAPRDERARRAAILAGAIVAPLVASTLFRIAYYGDPLPNTYYLKLTGTPVLARVGRGLSVFVDLLRSHLWAPLVFALAALRSRDLAGPLRAPGGSHAFFAALSWRASLAPLASIVLAQCVYSISVGGDAWEWMPYPNRYVAVAMPALLVLASVGAWRLVRALLGRTADAERETLLRKGWIAAAIALMAAAAFYAMRVGANPWAAGSYDIARKSAIALAFALGAGALLAWRVAPRGLARRLRGVGPDDLDSPAGRRTALAFGVVLFLALWLPTSGPGFKSWLFYNAAEAPIDETHARLGVLIARTTRADATVALARAGTIPYFSRRRSIDLFGKCDPVIAKAPASRADFRPGHTKWNLDYSVAELHPDIVVFGARDAAERAIFERAGYDSLAVELWVRRDSGLVDREPLARGWLQP